MKFDKPINFNNYGFTIKLLLLILPCILLLNCKQQQFNQNTTLQKTALAAENAINLNTAGREELKRLPHIGEGTAKNIIEYREKYGKFRRAENLILVRGMSDKKFRALQGLVKAE